MVFSVTRRLTNLSLLALVPALVASGLIGWAWPVGEVALTYPLHRALGVVLVLVLGWKWAIARGSLRRRLRFWPVDRSWLWGAGAAVLVLGTVGLGLGWTLGLLSYEALGGYSALNMHVFLGVGLLVPLAGHASTRWESYPPIGRLVTRRSVLRVGGVAALGALAAVVLGPDAERRFTGSKHAGSFSGNRYPVTIWFLDGVPRLDAASWSMTVAGRRFGYAELCAMPQREITAVLDCTGGWWSEQLWRGASVGAIFDAAGLPPGAASATVTSVTGHAWTFPIGELRQALLATHVGGEELTPGHGYPVRLAVPGRRGFQWVKWVDRIEAA